MKDGRENNGGARPGAGRKTKGEEQELVERLKPYDNVALAQLIKGVEENEKWAVQMFFAYRYGKPVETQRVYNLEEQPLFPDV